MQVCGGLYVGDPDTQVHVYLHHVLELGVCVRRCACVLFTHTKTHTQTYMHVASFAHYPITDLRESLLNEKNNQKLTRQMKF